MSGRQGAEIRSATFARPEWMSDAECLTANPDDFFGYEYEQAAKRYAREQRAKAVCRVCPVRQECLDHALSVPEKAGVWGAMGEDERERLRERQAKAKTRKAAK